MYNGIICVFEIIEIFVPPNVPQCSPLSPPNVPFLGEVQLLPGTYDYSYQCTLPNDLPSSFLGCWGSIKYSSQVVINIPRWPDKTFKQKFVLLKPLDLNDFPSLRVICLLIFFETSY